MIRVLRSLLLLAPVWMLACGPSAKELPPPSFPKDSLISQPLMIQVLADVQEIEAGLTVMRNQGKDPGVLTQELYDGLYRKYHISETRFRDNLSYYRTDPENFLKLYEQVLQELKDRQNRYRLPSTKNTTD